MNTQMDQGQIILTFPTGYTILSGLSCQLLLTSAQIGIGCVSNSALLTFTVTLNAGTSLLVGNNYDLRVKAKNPGTEGLTGAFSLKFQSSESLVYLTESIPGVVITSQ
jgi:hypothetical protein